LFYDVVDLLFKQLGGFLVFVSGLGGCPSVKFEN